MLKAAFSKLSRVSIVKRDKQRPREAPSCETVTNTAASNEDIEMEVGGVSAAADKSTRTPSVRFDPSVLDEFAGLEMSLSCTLVIVYKVYIAFNFVSPTASVNYQDRPKVRALLWVLGCLVIGILEVLMLLSLMLTSNWPGCASPDDCSLGLECAHTIDGGVMQNPKCLDCYYLSDYGGPTDPGHVPWGFPLIGQIPENTNATSRCMNAMYDPVNT